MGGLEKATLLWAEVEGGLQLCRLAGPLCAEEDDRRVGGHDRALVGAEQVPRILGGEDERDVVLADAPRQADDEPADGRVLEQQPELVDDEHAPAVPTLDPRPERFGEEEVD